MARQAALPLHLPAEQLEPTEFDVAGADLRLLRKAETVLSRRTASIIVVLERLQDGHNYCAVLRTMEALGVQHVWLVSPPPMESKNTIKRRAQEVLAQEATTTRTRKRAQERVDALWSVDAQEDEKHLSFAKRAQGWLTVREFDTTGECVQALRAEGRAIWCTALEQNAEVLSPGAPWLENDLPQRLAVVMGAEESGVSDAFKAASDRLVYLPLHGFAESLNVSVATALVVQLLLQLYANARLPSELCLTAEEERSLRIEWYMKLARNDEERERYMSYVENPPAPLHDVRRPDSHRVARGQKPPRWGQHGCRPVKGRGKDVPAEVSEVG
eukprot:gnl/TRDRNA2_/TRDRNA2_39341_c0_seq1.p1 gnl/TRDRNA2_/TRDRNA2_39341_c0~~gnl/TRDRNA2_/TRDRNA2_39341_c0_seq1.p1  ORF type:complete len:372 (+),score=59.06 gnl/TRDRNA2_/TRDRNA2_39341_c0_seq1:130-1116(+)